MTRTLPAVLLVAIALHQIIRAEWSSLSPWKGGGFGMFATTDRGLTRRVHAYWLPETEPGPISRTDGTREPLAIPGDLANLQQRARTLPDATRLAVLAHRLAEVAGQREPDAQAVEVEVWRIGFTEDLALTGELLGHKSVPVPGAGHD